MARNIRIFVYVILFPLAAIVGLGFLLEYIIGNSPAFVYLIAIAEACHSCVMSARKNFRGASMAAFDFLSFCTGFGAIALWGLIIWACFLTTWWHPLVASFIGGLIYICL